MCPLPLKNKHGKIKYILSSQPKNLNWFVTVSRKTEEDVQSTVSGSVFILCAKAFVICREKAYTEIHIDTC